MRLFMFQSGNIALARSLIVPYQIYALGIKKGWGRVAYGVIDSLVLLNLWVF